ncbi:hypothetical protein PHAVU_002G066214 [Phaseolus vulgaris]
MGQVFGCVQVEQSSVAIREVFGKYDDVLEPGCHCVPWCLGSRVAGALSLRVKQLDVRCETKTKDNVFCYCGCFYPISSIGRKRSGCLLQTQQYQSTKTILCL